MPALAACAHPGLPLAVQGTVLEKGDSSYPGPAKHFLPPAKQGLQEVL